VPRWISSVAAWTNSDLVASGSSDGYIRFWKCGERLKSLTPVFEVPCPGWVNSLEFSSGVNSGKKRSFVAVGVGKEHKLGRWFETNKGANNCILIIPIIPKDTTSNLNNHCSSDPDS
jgi:ribosomal RNA-processing protein 9